MDIVEPKVRSRMMSSVRSKDTKPEQKVRSLLHKMGFRFRLHKKDLPGKPDIVLSKYQTVIFVHGCFWHQHPGCPKSKRPSSRVHFWEKKLNQNMRRDAVNIERLKKLGWYVHIVWECQTKDNDNLIQAIMRIFSYNSTAMKNFKNSY